MGYFKLNIGAAQTDVHDPNALEIERIYVVEHHQGKNWFLDAQRDYWESQNIG